MDNCGANWNEQALLAAQDYMEYLDDLTRDTLLTMLEFDGFTDEQAEYAVDQLGL